MADEAISVQPDAAVLDGTEYFVLVQSGATKKAQLGTAASKDVGTASVEVPQNSDLGTAAYEPVTKLLPSGAIMPFAMTTAPSGWLTADGSAVSRSTYSDLFDAIGTTWGAGDGSTTFNLPDLQGAFLRGAGDGTINSRTKSGGSVGDYTEDQMQRITGATGDVVWKYMRINSGAISYSSSYNNQEASNGSDYSNRDLNFDSADSPDARTSSATDGETYPYHATVKYCIKY